MVSAFSGTQVEEPEHSDTLVTGSRDSVGFCTAGSVKTSFAKPLHHFAVDLVACLPSREVADLLVDTYFDRVHWFLLVFHQDEFRHRFAQLYRDSQVPVTVKQGEVGFTSTLLAVMALALQYIGEYRLQLLSHLKVDAQILQDKIFSTLRTRVLDVVSLGSLEAVQTCILLGSYFLYHGDPGLAWPICGCALRIAQALNLHRRLPLTASTPASGTSKPRRSNEVRKRCWWAVYEIETFCSMLYGHPHSILDADCDVEFLDASAKPAMSKNPRSFNEPLSCETTLLSYKYFMSRLSILIRAALTELYGVNRNSPNGWISGAGDHASRLQVLVEKVTELDNRLSGWASELPSRLQLRSDTPKGPIYESLAEIDEDIGASGEKLESYIFQLQALALKLAYENARILIHRPLLSYKMVSPPTPDYGTIPAVPARLPNTDPFQSSLLTCRNAALETSRIGSFSIFRLASGTYAVAFIGSHLLTAGVALCILASIDPLSISSQESKIGIHRLLGMQMDLKRRSVLAAQGLEVLQKLTKLVLTKELEKMLQPKSDSRFGGTYCQELTTSTPMQTEDGGSISQNHSLQQPSPQTSQLDLNRMVLHHPGMATQSASQRSNDDDRPELMNYECFEDPIVTAALLDFESGTVALLEQKTYWS